MYRKSSGKLGFSFGLFSANALLPAAYIQTPKDIDLSPLEKDALFRWQIQQSNPKLLHYHCFRWAGIVDNESQSLKVLSALQRASILSSHPSDPTVYTDRITKNFSNQMACIPYQHQRKLVSLLFFWEEELVRFKLLDEEENEIRLVLSQMEGPENGAVETLQIALGNVARKRMLAPAARGEVSPEASRQDQLPGYGEQMGSVTVTGGRAGLGRREGQ